MNRRSVQAGNASFVAKLFKNRSGQATVEFALVMPILMLIMIGIFEFGRAWNTQQAITDAAREGARKAAIHNQAITGAAGYDSVRTTVRKALAAVNLDSTKATVDTLGISGAQGTPATVTVQYPYTFVFLGKLMSWGTGQKSFQLRSQFTMRNE